MSTYTPSNITYGLLSYISKYKDLPISEEGIEVCLGENPPHVKELVSEINQLLKRGMIRPTNH